MSVQDRALNLYPGVKPHLKGGLGAKPPSLGCFCAYTGLGVRRGFSPSKTPSSHLWSPVLRDYLILTNYYFFFYCDTSKY